MLRRVVGTAQDILTRNDQTFTVMEYLQRCRRESSDDVLLGIAYDVRSRLESRRSRCEFGETAAMAPLFLARFIGPLTCSFIIIFIVTKPSMLA